MKPLPPLAGMERLLIVKTSSIGDVIHALPVVQAIKEARPALKLGWVVRRRCADVLRGNPWVDRLHVVEDKPSPGQLIGLSGELRREDYGCALDMQGLLLSGLIARLSGAPIRVGWDRNREGSALLLTHPVVPGRAGDRRGDRHEVDALYGFAEALGVHSPHPDFTPQPFLAEVGRAETAAWIVDLPRPRIVLNVGASRAYKRWPAEHWAGVADALAARGRGLVFVGDAKDAETVAEVTGAMRPYHGIVNLAGKTTLRQLGAVLGACDLVVSGDSGPMHLAVAVGTPVVAIFGATNPARHGPYGARNRVVCRTPPGQALTRRPTDAEGEAAMQAVTPGEVVSTVEEILTAAAPD